MSVRSVICIRSSSHSRKRFPCDPNASICKSWQVAGIPPVSHSRFSGIYVQGTDLTRTHSSTTRNGSCQALLLGRPRMPQCLFIATDCLATMQREHQDRYRIPLNITRSTRDTLRGCGDSKWTSHQQRRQKRVQLKPLVCSTNTMGQTHLARHTPRSRLFPARVFLPPLATRVDVSCSRGH